MKAYLHLVRDDSFMPKYALECTGGQILNFQNTFDRTRDEIRVKIQSRIYLRNSNLNEIFVYPCSDRQKHQHQLVSYIYCIFMTKIISNYFTFQSETTGQ